MIKLIQNIIIKIKFKLKNSLAFFSGIRQTEKLKKNISHILFGKIW